MLSAGDFNYVLEEVNHDVNVALYCFLVSKILQCRRLKVKLNRPNALLHVKDNCPELSQKIVEGMNRTDVSQQDDIVIQIVFYFLHIEEYTTTDSKVIEAMLDAYHLKN
jgi:Sec7-like guanine-nucleotide exchange factor